MIKQNVDINIERLVLDGFNPSESSLIGEALSHELKRLITENSNSHSFPAGGEIAHIAGGPVYITRNVRAVDIGARIARSVYKGIIR